MTKNVWLFLVNLFLSLILQAGKPTVILQYSLFNKQHIPFYVLIQKKRILMDCLGFLLPKRNASEGMKRFVAVSHLAFKRHICRLVGITFLSARSYVFSTFHRSLVYSIDCCVNIL